MREKMIPAPTECSWARGQALFVLPTNQLAQPPITRATAGLLASTSDTAGSGGTEKLAHTASKRQRWDLNPRARSLMALPSCTSEFLQQPFEASLFLSPFHRRKGSKGQRGAVQGPRGLSDIRAVIFLKKPSGPRRRQTWVGVVGAK